MTTIQVMKINLKGQRFKFIFNANDNVNPFYLYEHTVTLEHGTYGVKKHRKLLQKYCCFESCLYHLLQLDIPDFRRGIWA